MPATLTLIALEGIPEVERGQSIVDLLIAGLKETGIGLETGDAVVICQKIVSKAEDRKVALNSVTPSERALKLARICEKEPALVELVLRESTEVLRCLPGVIVVRHKLGFVLANAGIDQSNVAGGEGHALLLPENPDKSAGEIRAALKRRLGVDVAVLINDSFGRAWRLGTTGTCLGAAGLLALQDLRGKPDRFGRQLRVTEVGAADELAAAASCLMGQSDEGRPIVVVKGVPKALLAGERPASALIRPLDKDLFR